MLTTTVLNTTLAHMRHFIIPTPSAPSARQDHQDHEAIRDYYTEHIAHLRPPRDKPTPAFTPPKTETPKPSKINIYTPIGVTTLGDVFAQYVEAAWSIRTHPSPQVSQRENIKQDVVNFLGGPKSPRGMIMAQRFENARTYLRDLANAERRLIQSYPQHAERIRDTALSMKDAATGIFANGLLANNAEGTLQYRALAPATAPPPTTQTTTTGITTSTVDIAALAEHVVQQQTQDIKSFWRRQIDHADGYYRYAIHGEIRFDNEHDMEANCPPGDYRVRNWNRYDGSLTYDFEYEGRKVHEVHVRQADGSYRMALFTGPTWLYADKARKRDRMPKGQPMPPNMHRRANPYWNDDPRVVAARVAGSVLASVDD